MGLVQLFLFLPRMARMKTNSCDVILENSSDVRSLRPYLIAASNSPSRNDQDLAENFGGESHSNLETQLGWMIERAGH